MSEENNAEVVEKETTPQVETTTTTNANNDMNVNNMFKNRRRNDKIKRIVKRVVIIGLIVVGYLYLKNAPKEQQIVQEFNYD